MLEQRESHLLSLWLDRNDSRPPCYQCFGLRIVNLDLERHRQGDQVGSQSQQCYFYYCTITLAIACLIQLEGLYSVLAILLCLQIRLASFLIK